MPASDNLYSKVMIIPERVHFVSWQVNFHKNFSRLSYMKQDLLERTIASCQDIKEYALAKRTVVSWNYPSSTGAILASSESFWSLQGKFDKFKELLASPQGHLSIWITIFFLLFSLKSNVICPVLGLWPFWIQSCVN